MNPIETRDFGISQIMVAGIPVRAHVIVQIYFDECFEPDWDFLPGEKEKLERDIERGNATPCGIVVKAYAEGIPVEAGEDSLWGTLVYHPSDIDSTVAEYSMIATACTALERQILDTVKALKPFSVAV